MRKAEANLKTENRNQLALFPFRVFRGSIIWDWFGVWDLGLVWLLVLVLCVVFGLRDFVRLLSLLHGSPNVVP